MKNNIDIENIFENPAYFREIILNQKGYGVHNCEIMHYTRRNPESGTIGDHANWMRRIRPNESPVWKTGWQKIERPKYSNAELLDIVAQSPAVLE